MASASSECDNLQVALNDKRCAEMGLGDEKLQRLDRLLDRCNKKHVGSGAQCHDASARCLRVIHAGDLPASVFIELVSFAPQGLGFCAGGRVLDRTTLEKIFASISGLFGTDGDPAHRGPARRGGLPRERRGRERERVRAERRAGGRGRVCY